MPSAAEHGMGYLVDFAGALSDESASLGVVSWSEWSHCPRNDSGYCLNQENLIFFSFFSSELHKVAYQGWHVCDITCGVIRHNLFGQVDSNLVMIYRTWFWSQVPGLAWLVNLGKIEYNS